MRTCRGIILHYQMRSHLFIFIYFCFFSPLSFLPPKERKPLCFYLLSFEASSERGKIPRSRVDAKKVEVSVVLWSSMPQLAWRQWLSEYQTSARTFWVILFLFFPPFSFFHVLYSQQLKLARFYFIYFFFSLVFIQSLWARTKWVADVTAHPLAIVGAVQGPASQVGPCLCVCACVFPVHNDATH